MNVVELIDVSKRFGEVAAVDRISFEVSTGQIISLLGPSGCGKTTTLRLIAGFEAPDHGVIRIAGMDVVGKRPYERNVGLLFQDYALFPHMTVEQNVAFGLRYRGFERSEIPERTREMLALVKLSGMEQRRPSQLSGGQQQRVALARALATRPEVMLLDEPLSALDAKLRQELRVELKEILSSVGTTTIVVTHDQEEAMSLAEHIIVMNRGRIMQRGSPTGIYSRPASKFVAEFIGRSNWFAGRLAPTGHPDLHELETSSGLKLFVFAPGIDAAPGCEVCLRPERIEVLRSDAAVGTDADLPGNLLCGIVADAVHLGADVHLLIDLEGGQRLTAIQKDLGQLPDERGEPVKLRFSARDCIVVRAEQD